MVVRMMKRMLKMERQTKTSAVIFVGYETERSKDWREVKPDFQAPKNVTKPETIAKKIAEKEEEYEREAQGYIYSGSVSKIVTLEPGEGQRVFDGAKDFIENFNRELVNLTRQRFDSEGYPIDGAVRFVGPNIRTFVKMLWAEMSVKYHDQLPPGMLHTTHVDVGDVLVPSGFKTNLDVSKILQFYYRSSPFGEDAASDARVSALVALAHNLFPHLKFEISELFPESEGALC